MDWVSHVGASDGVALLLVHARQCVLCCTFGRVENVGNSSLFGLVGVRERMSKVQQGYRRKC